MECEGGARLPLAPPTTVLAVSASVDSAFRTLWGEGERGGGCFVEHKQTLENTYWQQ